MDLHSPLCLMLFVLLQSSLILHKAHAVEEIIMRTESYEKDEAIMYYKPVQLKTSQINSMTLRIKSCHSAYLSLLVEGRGITDKFVIRFGNKTRKSDVTVQKFRSCAACDPDEDENRITYIHPYVGTLLTCEAFRGFWIHWYQHELYIGDIGRNAAFMTLGNTNSEPSGDSIHTIGVASSHGTSADWIIDVPGNFYNEDRLLAQQFSPIQKDSRPIDYQEAPESGSGYLSIGLPVGAAFTFLVILVFMTLVRTRRHEIAKRWIQSVRKRNVARGTDLTYESAVSDNDPDYRGDVLTSQARLDDLHHQREPPIYSLPTPRNNQREDSVYDNNFHSDIGLMQLNPPPDYEDINEEQLARDSVIERSLKRLRKVGSYEDVVVPSMDLSWDVPKINHQNAESSLSSEQPDFPLQLCVQELNTKFNANYENTNVQVLSTLSKRPNAVGYENVTLSHTGEAISESPEPSENSVEQMTIKANSDGEQETQPEPEITDSLEELKMELSKVLHKTPAARYTPGQLDGSELAQELESQKLAPGAITCFKYNENVKT